MKYLRAFALAPLFFGVLSTRAQDTSQSYLRNTPNETEREDPRIQAIITRAEEHFKLGQLNHKSGKLKQAREEFDKAIDTVLESGLDVRAYPRLQQYYLQLVESVYGEEVPWQQYQEQRRGAVARSGPSEPQTSSSTPAPTGQKQPVEIGFGEQKFEPSPLDEAARLVLEEEVRPATSKNAAALLAKSPTVRGLKLGMSAAQVRATLPSLRIPAADEFGRAKVAGPPPKGAAGMKDVKWLSLEFIDNRLVDFGFIYQSGVEWEVSEFAEKISASLNLPRRWEEPALAYAERRLTCKGFDVTVIVLLRARRNPILRITEAGAYDIVALRKAEKEQKRKAAFKP